MVNSHLRVFFTDRDRPGEKRQIQSSFLCGLILNSREDLLEDTGYAHEDRWFHLAQVLPDLVERFAKIDSHTVMQIHVHGKALKDMRQRQHRKRLICFIKRKMPRGVN